MLTEQRKRYAEGRAAGLSKRDAAIAAGCPARTASQAGARHERNPEVLEAIALIQAGKPLALVTARGGAGGGLVGGAPEPDGDPLPPTDDPRVWLRAAMVCPRVPINERVRAAAKLADLEAKEKRAEKPRTNKFRKTALSLVNGGRPPTA